MALDPLAQFSDHSEDIVKLIPPFVFDKTDADRFIEPSDRVLEEVHKFPRPVRNVGFSLGESDPAIGGAGVPKDGQ